MKKILATLCLTLFSFGIVQGQFEIPEKPERQTSYYDYVGLLNSSGARFLEEKLLKYSDSTSTQIVIVIINSTNGENILELATRWGNEWGIGQKEKDNGIVLLMAKEDREVAIATGEGLRDQLTDAKVKNVIDYRIVPEFKKGQYYRGLDRGIDAIIEILKGKFKANAERKTRSENRSTSDDGFSRYVPMILLGIVSLIFYLFTGRFLRVRSDDDLDRRDRSDDDDWGSGSSGGGFSGGGFGGGSFSGGGASGRW